jgi:hypothetical protein
MTVAQLSLEKRTHGTGAAPLLRTTELAKPSRNEAIQRKFRPRDVQRRSGSLFIAAVQHSMIRVNTNVSDRP